MTDITHILTITSETTFEELSAVFGDVGVCRVYGNELSHSITVETTRGVITLRPESEEGDVLVYSGVLVLRARSVRVCRIDEGRNSAVSCYISMDGVDYQGGFNSSLYYRI